MIKHAALIGLGLFLTYAPALLASPESYIYGTIETRTGQAQTGFIRWGKEEIFWTDHFNSKKLARPGFALLNDAEQEAIRDKRSGPTWNLGGMTIEFVSFWPSDPKPRSFGIQFGDISRIEMLDEELVRLELRNGSKIELDGASNDIGARLRIRSGGEWKKLSWKKIVSVSFAQAPADSDYVPAPALFGMVDTSSDKFEGYIQWDHDERIGTDVLDGNNDNGEQEITFSNIAGIKKSGDQSLVRLADGRELLLGGTNDVNKGNRGVIVSGANGVRVDIPWKEFIDVDFFEPKFQSRFYDQFDPGSYAVDVSVAGGEARSSGKMYFDLDASQGYEILHVAGAGISYFVPLYALNTLTRNAAGSAQMSLRNGESIDLDPRYDLGDGNLGLAIEGPGGNSFTAWSAVTAINLNW